MPSLKNKVLIFKLYLATGWQTAYASTLDIQKIKLNGSGIS
jgi:hypothetical protein